MAFSSSQGGCSSGCVVVGRSCCAVWEAECVLWLSPAAGGAGAGWRLRRGAHLRGPGGGPAGPDAVRQAAHGQGGRRPGAAHGVRGGAAFLEPRL